MVLMRKLPPSLTALAWRGSGPTIEMPRDMRFKHRTGAGDGAVGSGGHDPETALVGDVGPAEDGGGNKIDAAAGVLGGEAFD